MCDSRRRWTCKRQVSCLRFIQLFTQLLWVAPTYRKGKRKWKNTYCTARRKEELIRKLIAQQSPGWNCPLNGNARRVRQSKEWLAQAKRAPLHFEEITELSALCNAVLFRNRNAQTRLLMGKRFSFFSTLFLNEEIHIDVKNWKSRKLLLVTYLVCGTRQPVHETKKDTMDTCKRGGYTSYRCRLRNQQQKDSGTLQLVPTGWSVPKHASLASLHGPQPCCLPLSYPNREAQRTSRWDLPGTCFLKQVDQDIARNTWRSLRLYLHTFDIWTWWHQFVLSCLEIQCHFCCRLAP